MTRSLERELESFVVGSDYRLALWAQSYVHVTVYYMVNGRGVQIGHKLFGGYWRWRRARRFVERTIAGHRALLRAGVMIQP